LLLTPQARASNARADLFACAQTIDRVKTGWTVTQTHYKSPGSFKKQEGFWYHTPEHIYFLANDNASLTYLYIEDIPELQRTPVTPAFCSNSKNPVPGDGLKGACNGDIYRFAYSEGSGEKAAKDCERAVKVNSGAHARTGGKALRFENTSGMAKNCCYRDNPPLGARLEKCSLAYKETNTACDQVDRDLIQAQIGRCKQMNPLPPPRKGEKPQEVRDNYTAPKPELLNDYATSSVASFANAELKKGIQKTIAEVGGIKELHDRCMKSSFCKDRGPKELEACARTGVIGKKDADKIAYGSDIPRTRSGASPSSSGSAGGADIPRTR
jgi:hypothetical protein